jgi:hypothetical protein
MKNRQKKEEIRRVLISANFSFISTPEFTDDGMSIDTSQASIAHGAKADSDLARLRGDHPGPASRTDSVLHIHPVAIIRPRSRFARVFSLGAQHAAGNRPRSERSRVPVIRSAARSGSRMRLPGRLGDRGGAGRRRTGPGAAYPGRAWSAQLNGWRRCTVNTSWRSSPRRSCGGRADKRHERASFAGRGSGGSIGDVRPPRHCDAAGASGWGIGDDPDTHTMDIKGTRNRPGVINPGRWRGGRSSDSDDRSLHIAGSGHPAGPRHSTALNGVRSRTPAWARLNRVEGGDSRRSGQSRTMIQDVPLEVGHACQLTTVTELFRNDSLLSFI